MRRVFDGDLAYRLVGRPLHGAPNAPVLVFEDEAGTTLADIRAYPGGAAVPGSMLTTDSLSRRPLFYGPDDSTDTLYVSVDGGPITPVYARTDDRIDVVENEAGTTIGRDGTLTGGNPTVEFTTRWGIDADGVPYYDDEGAASGEEAVLSVDSDGVFILTRIGG